MNSCLFDLLTHCVVFPRCVFAPSLVLTRISYSIFIHFLVPVVGRKVAFSAIGVFGSQLGEFQVHLTSVFFLMLILSTAVMRPFNKKKKKKALSFINRWLQSLELASLSAVWLTLWAGAVFLSYPGCVAADDRDEINEELLTDTGSEMRPASATLPWCDAISVIVGIVDILVLLAVVVCFVVTSRRLRMQDL